MLVKGFKLLVVVAIFAVVGIYVSVWLPTLMIESDIREEVRKMGHQIPDNIRASKLTRVVSDKLMALELPGDVSDIAVSGGDGKINLTFTLKYHGTFHGVELLTREYEISMENMDVGFR